MHPSLQREMRGLPEALLTPAVWGNQAGWETSEIEQLHAWDMKSAPGHSLPDAPLSIRQGAIPGSPPCTRSHASVSVLANAAANPESFLYSVLVQPERSQQHLSCSQ